jgi:hypothetical protein
MALSFPATPADGSTYVLGGITFTYSVASNSWVGIIGSTTIIAQGAILGDGTAGTPLTVFNATETQVGVAQIITQPELDASIPVSANDTDILTVKKLLNMADPFKQALIDVLFPSTVSMNSMAHLNGVYVGAPAAPASAFKADRSTDLTTWTRTWTDTDGTSTGAGAYTIAAGGSVFLGAGFGSNHFIRSTDSGLTWVKRNYYPTLPNPNTVQQIYYDGTRFVIRTSNGDDTAFFTTTDGSTMTTPRVGWTVAQNLAMEFYESYDFVKGATEYVIVGSGAPGSIKILNQTTFAPNIALQFTTGSTPRSVAYSSSLGRYVTVGDAGYVYTAPNGGTAWTLRTFPAPYDLYQVVWGNNKFVARAEGGRIYESPDGVTWTFARTLDGSLIFDGTRFVTSNCVTFT